MEREQWLEQRRKGIGGSDSPVILGVSPFKTVRELWDEKLGLVEDAPPTAAMERGTYLEPVAAQLYMDKTGRKVKRVNDILRHKEHDWMLANIDRQIQSENGKGPGILEIKCPGLSVFSKCKREGLQDYYIVQLQHYLAVSDRSWGAFAVFNAERWELIHFDVDRDQELIDLIISHDRDFWQMVQEGRVPEETAPVVDLPPVEPTELYTMDSPAWKEAIERLREAQEIKKEAMALEDDAKATVQLIMEQAGVDVAEGAGARVYYRMQNGRKSFDKTLLKKDHPEIDLKNYEKTGSPYKVFRPYFMKEVINE